MDGLKIISNYEIEGPLLKGSLIVDFFAVLNCRPREANKKSKDSVKTFVYLFTVSGPGLSRKQLKHYSLLLDLDTILQLISHFSLFT